MASPLHIAAAVAFAASVCFACGGEERRPNVPASTTVQDLRRSAGSGVQDCGESQETRKEQQCRIHSVGECLQSAMKECRSAYGVRSYFTSEGDPIRLDWLVLSDGHGGCKLITVEDRSADPLARKAPKVRKCTGITWKHHESIPDCEAPSPDGCVDQEKPADDEEE